ncbi:hypothetical protein MKY95_19380 [Paenibacillus sp. FSL P4-0176]|uniref:hypothetical protein n=1 Tax=Paenibacillus sp. FSL P4-0176 TaxID=2921631 RepID=UPI0030CDBD6A
MINQKCVFCNGKGVIPHFHHIENGKCFRCNGTGKMISIAQEKETHQEVCYCGKKHFKAGDECVSILLDSDQFTEYQYVYFHNDVCSHKYMTDNKAEEMYITNTRF